MSPYYPIVLTSPVPKSERGTEGSLIMVWKGHRDRGHPPCQLLLTEIAILPVGPLATTISMMKH